MLPLWDFLVCSRVTFIVTFTSLFAEIKNPTQEIAKHASGADSIRVPQPGGSETVVPCTALTGW
jgi:hypothetical protein